MMERDYIQGSAKVQIALVLLLVLSIGLFFYLSSVIGQVLEQIQLLSGSEPELAIRMAGRLLLWLVFFSGSIAVAIAIYLFMLTIKVKQFGIYPPPGMPVAFKTPIKKGVQAARMQRLCAAMGLILLLQPVAGLYIWYVMTGAAW